MLPRRLLHMPSFSSQSFGSIKPTLCGSFSQASPTDVKTTVADQTKHKSYIVLICCNLFLCFAPPHSEPSQPLERLHAGRVHRHRHGWLLVRLYPEPLLQGPHEEDDEGPGGVAES